MPKGAGAVNGLALKGGLLSPEQPTAAPKTNSTPQQATTQGAAQMAPQPTTVTITMVTEEPHHKLSPPVSQALSEGDTHKLIVAMFFGIEYNPLVSPYGFLL